eukprot:5787987-Prymnesium_polylepis.2
MPSSKGFVIEAVPGAGGRELISSTRGTESLTFAHFGRANEFRHMLSALAAQHSTEFKRERAPENERLRARFDLDSQPDLVVLHEYPCALMHAEGSSTGKMYIMQRCICFAGSLMGKDTVRGVPHGCPSPRGRMPTIPP